MFFREWDWWIATDSRSQRMRKEKKRGPSVHFQAHKIVESQWEYSQTHDEISIKKLMFLTPLCFQIYLLHQENLNTGS